jgi:hypothetical protein
MQIGRLVDSSFSFSIGISEINTFYHLLGKFCQNIYLVNYKLVNLFMQTVMYCDATLE